MVSFINNGSEIKTWMEHLFFFNLKLHIIRLAQGRGSGTPTH